MNTYSREELTVHLLRGEYIRHGKFVSAKRDYSVAPLPTAEEFRVLMPIPLQNLIATLVWSKILVTNCVWIKIE